MDLKFYPVCECGYVFKNLKIIENKKILSNKYATVTHYGKPIFNPGKCPKCGEIIESIEWDLNIKEIE